MVKDIFRDNSLVDKNKLRKERKAILAFIIWFTLLLGVGLFTMNEMLKYPGLTIGKLIGIISFLLSLSCGIAGLIAIRRLTNIVYKNPNKYLTLYIILIILGCLFMGIFTIIALFKIWFDARKLLIETK